MESGVDKWGRSVDNPKNTMEGRDVHEEDSIEPVGLIFFFFFFFFFF